jgi:hypothetical protein
MEAIRSGPLGKLHRPDNYVNGQSGAGRSLYLTEKPARQADVAYFAGRSRIIYSWSSGNNFAKVVLVHLCELAYRLYY